ncbi:MAG: O-Antigen polymerase, partial [Acidimicrobiales bacterium]|nr:O-Antigen polymerase [Acidimicrobiales bacterium]
MPTSALLLLGAAVAGYLVLAPLRRALLGALATQVLLPGVLVVPNPLSAYPTFGRVALVALAANVARRWWRGDLADDAWRWTPVHAALALLVLVGLVNGVLLAQPELSTWDTLHGWASLVDQLVLFALATAVLRTDPDPRWLLRGIGAVVVASATLGALEHLTGGAWGHWLFSHRPSLQGLDAAHALDLRGGRTRVRAGAEFALEFAWVSVMLLPALVAATTLLPRRDRWLGLALPVLVVAAVYWSYSRSPLPFVAVGVVAVWAGSSFSRRVGVLLATLVAGGALFVLTSPNLLTPLTTSSNQATVDVRRERLPRVAALVADRPVQGLGIGGLDRAGIPTTDASYQRAYGQFGVVGATWLVVTVAVAIGATARSLRARSRLGRSAGAAMTAGVVAGAFGAASFDLFSLGGSAAVFWLLVGGGVVFGEQAGGRVPVWRESAGRAGVVLVAVAAGTVLAMAWPRQVVGTARY